MDLRFPRLRLVAIALASACFAVACASGSIEDVQRQLEGKEPSNGSSEGRGALDVKPPPPVTARLEGRAGIVVATNSPTWRKLADSADQPGVVALFVQPDGPSAGKGIDRGDVITKVDGEPSLNAERAVTLLLSKVGERRELEIVETDGATRKVSIAAKDPGNAKTRDYYDPLVDDDPDDAVLRFLRAQAPGTFDQQLGDIDKAIELEPGFVEAISYRAELVWNRAVNDPDLSAEKLEEERNKAIDDWNLALRLDDENTRVLGVLANALALRGNLASARRYARQAIGIDETYPPAHYSLAITNVLLGRYEEAAAPARTAIDLNPYDVRYYRTLAMIFIRLDRRKDAEATVDAIIKLVEPAAARDELRKVLDGDARP